MASRRVLIAYYSHTYHTRKVADHLAGLLEADQHRIVPEQDFHWPLGIFRAGKLASRGETQPLVDDVIDPGAYELVIAGSPLWALRVSPPTRSWLEEHAARLPKLAFYITHGGIGGPRAFQDMADAAGQKPVSTVQISHHDESKGRMDEKLRAFADELPIGQHAMVS
jgi:flavodoxin